MFNGNVKTISGIPSRQGMGACANQGMGVFFNRVTIARAKGGAMGGYANEPTGDGSGEPFLSFYQRLERLVADVVSGLQEKRGLTGKRRVPIAHDIRCRLHGGPHWPEPNLGSRRLCPQPA